jgi:DNA repair protein SbcC/Rad50
MHLNKLIIRNFKKFRRADVEFQDGLTGIVGSNGAGKSTIVEAVAWALYGNRASSIKRDYIRNARSGDTDSVEIRLGLSLGSRELTIYRAMKGKSLIPEAILLLDGQRIATGTKDVDQRLEDILKISYQDFMKTFYARQKDLDNLLKEGGSGKREYLLKLLGLEDIKEKAIEEIKSDRTTLDEKRNRLAGALAEIGNVEARLEKAASDMLLAGRELEEIERTKSAKEATREKRKMELEAMNEKTRSHGLLAERATQLEEQERQEREIVNAANTRLAEIESLRKRLTDLGPKLERLASIEYLLELLEPKRMVYEEISRETAAAGAALRGEEKALLENKQRLLELDKDRALLDDLKPKEAEHTKVQTFLLCLEGLRDRYGELQTRQKEETVRREALLANFARTKKAIEDLHKARARLEEIAPCLEEEKRLKSELAELSVQREKQKDLEGFTSRKIALESRRARLEGEATRARQDLENLGSLEQRETELRRQDRDLDRLVTELNHILADLRGCLKVQELAIADAERSIKRVTALGAEGLCPTCERPLQNQRDHLLKKYETATAQAKEERERLQTKIAAQMELIDGATRSRSNLRLAFDDLNARKSRSSALQADLQSLSAQISESKSEQEVISALIKGLGDVSFNSQRLASLEAALRNLAPLILECASLAVRLEDLPFQETEHMALQKKMAIQEDKQEILKQQIEALGYAESNYIDAKMKLATLKPLHDRFLSLTDRVKQIPALKDRIIQQDLERERLVQALQALQNSQAELGFNPIEYNALHKERKDLATAEEEAQRVRVTIAAEPEMQKSLNKALTTLDNLEKDLAQTKEMIKRLAYSPAEHETARIMLVEAEEELELARKIVSEKKVQMGVLRADLNRLTEEIKRKKELERTAVQVGRKLEVVDTTRTLINGFMDQVLIRVKNEIAKTAGEILEEVSGKYSLLKIDDDFNILVEDSGEFYPISRYSGGEIDMIAVSVRVAISEYLMRFGPDGESYSFLILDEVFGSQDIEHREKMIQMLRSLEERFPQIIAISHISDVQGQFDNTLQVVEDEMGNSRVEAL